MILSFLPFFKQRGDKNMIIIAGLGNPGKQYDKTKHNVGFWVIDKLAKEYNIEVTKFKHKALIGEGNIAGKKVLLVKPQTYMNLSGESIREIIKFYKEKRFLDFKTNEENWFTIANIFYEKINLFSYKEAIELTEQFVKILEPYASNQSYHITIERLCNVPKRYRFLEKTQVYKN